LHAHICFVFHLPEALLFWAVFIWVFSPGVRLAGKTVRSASFAQDAGTFRLIMIGNQVAIFMGFVVSFLPWFVVPWPVISYIFGICLLFLGGVLRRICYRTLGKYFTVVVIVNPDQPVIDYGPYRWVRHPSYTAGFLIFFGIGFALGNWLSIAILFVATCLIYKSRIQAEEKALLETIGEPYRAYMSRTKRFIPFLV
jgi:protein-S-isoprenylcysteine O-methyltransferase Ste14